MEEGDIDHMSTTPNVELVTQNQVANRRWKMNFVVKNGVGKGGLGQLGFPTGGPLATPKGGVLDMRNLAWSGILCWKCVLV